MSDPYRDNASRAPLPFDVARDRYMRDPVFHALVDSLVRGILHLEMTPTEVREAAMLACIIVEERHPRPLTIRMDGPDHA